MAPVNGEHDLSVDENRVYADTQDAKDLDSKKDVMAERQGFEPWLEFPLNTLSKRAPSATRPSLRAS